MKTIAISGKSRENVGKLNTKMLRKMDHVPCVMYGGEEVAHFSAPTNDFRHLVYTPHVYLVDLEIDGKKHMAILKDIQFHPVTDKILHIDFLEIFEGKHVNIAVPVQLHGLAEGVKQGGKQTLEHRRLKVRALPKDLPDQLDIDVTNLFLGKSIKVGELTFDNLELLDPKNYVVVSVKLTRAARGMADDDEEEAEGEGASEDTQEATE